MARVLAAVDGSEETSCIADYIVDRLGGSVAMQVIVLNAQPKPQLWRTRGIAEEAIRDRLQELGQKAVALTTERLERAHIPTKARLELGDPTDTIMRCAREEGCDLIIMSAKRLGHIRGALVRSTGMTWGSIAAQVVKLADIPVIVVK